MSQLEYTFTRAIIDGNRVTVPKAIMDEWGLKVTDKLIVTFRKKPKSVQGITI